MTTQTTTEDRASAGECRLAIAMQVQGITEAAQAGNWEQLRIETIGLTYWLDELRANTPRYVHDCERCVFLGRIAVRDVPDYLDRDYDAYMCVSPRSIEYVARYSSDGPDYLSMNGMTGCTRCDHPALVRTIALATP